ncbi:methionyl-tRNA formyltransferase [Solilutibacter silvestris]|uniref:Methionyl-tRNA formyltransferase n=1 Tax=Solilutibacter silvestris TaxID=1645665 RepID=A0A2K1Q0E6_9GAMM|nr:methionyl-tRNA formyltransferase [Lysobacter silvestris]PNS08515.1 fmt: methionyl-tRNA formyltransferase [Lysobacter silvestris]
MRIVFAGTPEFAVPSLRAACERADVVAVYTQPDRPAGRGRALTPSPVKQEALQRGIDVRQPETLRDPEVQAQLRALEPDLIVTAAYGLILPKKVLKIPFHGCWNLHGSLLPRWRGAAPIQRAIEAGDAETGVCLMQMAAGLDTGPVLLSEATAIAADETSGELYERLADIAARVLAQGLELLEAGSPPLPHPQPEAGVTHAAKIEKAEARLDWNQPAEVLARKVRAFQPWPVAEATLAGERVRIHAAKVVAVTSDAEAGSVIAASRDGIDIACGAGVLRLLVLQREGGRTVSAGDYLNARRDAF